MRVLHFISTLGGGGAERQLVYLARGLRARGCDVHVAILSGGTHLAGLLEAGATVHRLSARSNYDPRLLPRSVSLVRRLRPDIVQTWLTQMDVIGGIAALLTRTRWILSERTSAPAYRTSGRHLLRRMIGHSASAVVANSQLGLEFWRSARGEKFVVPNALAADEIGAMAAPEIDTGDTKVILFAGRFEEEKNLPTLIDALAESMRGRNVVALLCGAGPLEAAVRARLEALGLADRVHLLGYTDRLWGLMKRADVLVSASWFEGHPNIVLEGAACGCPLVLSDIAAHRNVLDDASADFAPPSDPQAIAAAILRALDDPAAARARARRARELVQVYSIPAAAEAYLRVYEQVKG